MKYIVTECEEHGKEIFVFSKNINHDTMMEGIERLRDTTGRNFTRVYRTPLSAGFVNGLLQCHGESESMDLVSNTEEDTVLLKKHLNLD